MLGPFQLFLLIDIWALFRQIYATDGMCICLRFMPRGASLGKLRLSFPDRWVSVAQLLMRTRTATLLLFSGTVQSESDGSVAEQVRWSLPRSASPLAHGKYLLR